MKNGIIVANTTNMILYFVKKEKLQFNVIKLEIIKKVEVM